MTVLLHKLAVTGPGKTPALLDFKGESHLVFGPTDTGKSYIVECLRYCLGGSRRPKDIGYSEGYNVMALQMSLSTGEIFTIFRDLTDDKEAIYEGLHVYPPQVEASPLNKEISQALVAWGRGAGNKILTKKGTLSNFAAGDLRRVSIFDEIETLNNVPFIGNDTNLKLRNRSALALILTGSDDSGVPLPPSTNTINVAKGYVEALMAEIKDLKGDLPEGMTKAEVETALPRVSAEIEQVNSYLQSHRQELGSLKQEHARIDKQKQGLTQQLAAMSEANSRLSLLDKKYVSDFQRLQSVATAASIVPNFETRPCPLCMTGIVHQARHSAEDENTLLLRQAAQAESEKIIGLRGGLRYALDDASKEIEELRHRLSEGLEAAKSCLQRQEKLLLPAVPQSDRGLAVLTEQKAILLMALRDLERLQRLETRLNEMKGQSKRQKQKIERDVSKNATLLVNRIAGLLKEWTVPGVNSVYFDETEADIKINQRKRTSYGKGKRGIFLAAYVTALMEQAIEHDYPHLGFVVIDSPVVTYKDPKYANEDSEELLEEGVKDNFYAWLASRRQQGQIIILENEEPDESLNFNLQFTEFVGPGMSSGRNGFFPT